MHDLGQASEHRPTAPMGRSGFIAYALNTRREGLPLIPAPLSPNPTTPHSRAGPTWWGLCCPPTAFWTRPPWLSTLRPWRSRAGCPR